MDFGYRCRKEWARPADQFYHVVYAVSKGYPSAAAATSVLSISASAKNKSATVVHYIADQLPISLVAFPFVRFHNLSAISDKYNLARLFNPRAVTLAARRLQDTGNFVRFVLAELLPGVSKCLWIDADTITRRDVGELFQEALQLHHHTELLAAVPGDKSFLRLSGRAPPTGLLGEQLRRFNAGVRRPRIPTANLHRIPAAALSPTQLKSPACSHTCALSRMSCGVCTFTPEVFALSLITNAMLAQVAVFNLRQWRCDGIADKTARIVEENARIPLYTDLGSQPLLSLVVGHRFEALHWRWNVDGLGWNFKNKCWPSDSGILHWSGAAKPWGPEGTCESLFTVDFDQVPIVREPATRPRPGSLRNSFGIACRACMCTLSSPHAPGRSLRHHLYPLPRARPD